MSEYVRYGDQWRNEVMKNRKSVIVDMLRRVAMERDNLESAAKQKRAADWLPCGHHKDAVIGDGVTKWCAACEAANR